MSLHINFGTNFGENLLCHPQNTLIGYVVFSLAIKCYDMTLHCYICINFLVPIVITRSFIDFYFVIRYNFCRFEIGIRFTLHHQAFISNEDFGTRFRKYIKQHFNDGKFRYSLNRGFLKTVLTFRSIHVKVHLIEMHTAANVKTIITTKLLF